LTVKHRDVPAARFPLHESGSRERDFRSGSSSPSSFLADLSRISTIPHRIAGGEPPGRREAVTPSAGGPGSGSAGKLFDRLR